MINNFEYIKEHMRFLNEKSFYFVQILKRKKENPEMKHYSIPIEAFYIFSQKQLDDVTPRIIELCEQNRARAYVKMNCLDAESVMLEQISTITQEIRKGNWKHMSKTLNSACGICGKQNDTEKMYLVDLDGMSVHSQEEIIIKDFINSLEPKKVSDKVKLEVPTKNGCHLLTTGFDMQTFRKSYPDIDIHNDGITLLYYPQCCCV